MNREPNPTGQDTEEDDPGALAGGVIYTVTFLLVAYIPATFTGELFGNRGLPLSPWLFAPLVSLALAVMMLLEPHLQSRIWWSRVQNVWGALLLGLSVVVPILLAVVRPMPVWTWLPLAVPTVLSFLPIALALWCVKRWHRHLRKRQRPELGPFTPVPRVSDHDPQD
ncbi:hypothetical protein [Streptomyces flavofungini]|uniref:hypothetical protein n=1 Tax=Streptomyces flavofungini TaxID=68200 RepID=UPI0034DE18B4